jgi:hypothetical protein
MTHLFQQEAGKAISSALKLLLSEKHLYQSVTVDASFIEKLVNKQLEECKRAEPIRGKSVNATLLKLDGVRVLNGQWEPADWGYAATGDTVTTFQFPTIHARCETCATVWPHTPVRQDGGRSANSLERKKQRYFLGYKCASCAAEIWFMVVRNGNKWQLVGRDPIEEFEPPKVLPKAIGKHFGDAQIAYHAGQTLPGVFLLRVFIEQFWRSTPAVKLLLAAQPKATGDQIGVAYNATLPKDFKERFPSLPDLYSKLSGAIHKAEADSMLFENVSAAIVEHFEARRLFKIVEPLPIPPAGQADAEPARPA